MSAARHGMPKDGSSRGSLSGETRREFAPPRPQFTTMAGVAPPPPVVPPRRSADPVILTEDPSFLPDVTSSGSVPTLADEAAAGEIHRAEQAPLDVEATVAVPVDAAA